MCRAGRSIGGKGGQDGAIGIPIRSDFSCYVVTRNRYLYYLNLISESKHGSPGFGCLAKRIGQHGGRGRDMPHFPSYIIKNFKSPYKSLTRSSGDENILHSSLKT